MAASDEKNPAPRVSVPIYSQDKKKKRTARICMPRDRYKNDRIDKFPVTCLIRRKFVLILNMKIFLLSSLSLSLCDGQEVKTREGGRKRGGAMGEKKDLGEERNHRTIILCDVCNEIHEHMQ